MRGGGEGDEGERGSLGLEMPHQMGVVTRHDKV